MTDEDTPDEAADPPFTPEEFEAAKFTDLLADVETAYRRAFDRVNGRYDRELVHAVDQQILDESEPRYDGGGSFSVDLPSDPLSRLRGVEADEQAREVLDAYVAEIERQLAVVFDEE
ncbi:MAG: DUF5783 family protein [Halobacteriaceae archaeon]